MLSGGPILVLTHLPFFKSTPGEEGKSFHPKSPASLLMKEFKLDKNFIFKDPHFGGFGGSTAEVVASLKGRVESLKEVHQKYLKIQNFKASGADLYAQWMHADTFKPKLTLFKNACAEVIDWPFDVSMLVCKRPAKLKTHDHLKSLTKGEFKRLIEITEQAVEFLKTSDKDFFKCVELFAAEQKRLGLIDKQAMNEVEQIKGLSSVLSARACGALGMDVVTVFCNLKEDIDKIKAKIVDLKYQLVTKLDYGDWSD